MKTTYRALMDALRAVEELAKQPAPDAPQPQTDDETPVDSWEHAVRQRRLLRKLNPLTEAATEVELADGVLARKYALREKVKGKERIVDGPDGGIVIEPAKIDAYTRERARMMLSEIDVDVVPLRREDFDGLAVPSGLVLALLGPFFDEG
jgi:hypothetical protein